MIIGRFKMNEICFHIKEKEIRLSFEEARELKQELDKLFMTETHELNDLLKTKKTVFITDYHLTCPQLQPVHVEDEKWDGKEIRTNNHIQINEANKWTFVKVHDDNFFDRQLYYSKKSENNKNPF